MFANSKSRGYFQTASLSFLWFQEGLCRNKIEWQHVCLYLKFCFASQWLKTYLRKVFLAIQSSASGVCLSGTLSDAMGNRQPVSGTQWHFIYLKADKSLLMLVFPEPQAPRSHPISPVPWGLLQSFWATCVSGLCERAWNSNHRKWLLSVVMMAARGWSETLVCHSIAYRSS